MSDQKPQKNAPEGSSAAKTGKARVARRGERPLAGQADENVINAPSRQTLIILGVICTATLVMWAAGRAACNYHPPTAEGLTPRAVSLENKTKMPKGVAMEFAQALSGADWELASQLVAEGSEGLLADEKKCGDCAARKAARAQLLSAPEVLMSNRHDSVVAVQTSGGPEGQIERIFRIRRRLQERGAWRVTEIIAGRDSLPTLEEPPASAAPAPPRSIAAPPASPASPGSAAPAPSAAPVAPAGD